MKRLLLIPLILLAGCVSPDEKKMTCETAEAAYVAYREAVAAGHTPSKEEIIAVAGAAQFLRIWCGWGVTARNPWPMDQNLVPILNKP